MNSFLQQIIRLQHTSHFYFYLSESKNTIKFTLINFTLKLSQDTFFMHFFFIRNENISPKNAPFVEILSYQSYLLLFLSGKVT